MGYAQRERELLTQIELRGSLARDSNPEVAFHKQCQRFVQRRLTREIEVEPTLM